MVLTSTSVAAITTSTTITVLRHCHRRHATTLEKENDLMGGLTWRCRYLFIISAASYWWTCRAARNEKLEEWRRAHLGERMRIVIPPECVMPVEYHIRDPYVCEIAHVSCDARLHEMEKRHQEEIADLRWANAELSSQLQAFGMKLDELCCRMSPPLTFYVPADAYDQNSANDDDDASPTG
ncbi:hypothetical protein COCNU_10G009220 [Cocos nucifera]|uniref:Uncharacterized protein n=1 Tax=Cocos nucifera TaxID=13894 RepID=A0A8K0IP61_COCNU|nr:hypothetical protein COCNU_10G009220 [Cocos nucifera]